LEEHVAGENPTESISTVRRANGREPRAGSDMPKVYLWPLQMKTRLL
jgi:hypothetical protein